MNPPSSMQRFCGLPQSNSGAIAKLLLMDLGHYIIVNLQRKSMCVEFHSLITTSTTKIVHTLSSNNSPATLYSFAVVDFSEHRTSGAYGKQMLRFVS